MKKKVLFAMIIALATCLSVNMVRAKEAARLTIDLPTNNTSVLDSIYLAGWAMSDIANTTVKYQIDNDSEQAQTITNRVERPDVLKAIKGYGDETTNPKPGFDTRINVENLEEGQHTLLVELLTEDEKNVLTKEEIKFVKRGPNSIINADYPVENGTAIDNLFIGGWTLSEVGDTTLKYKIDGSEEKEVTHRVERNDVLNAIKGYGNITTNPKPGFDGSIDISGLDYKMHTLTLLLYDKEGKLLTQVEKHFTKKAPVSTISLDYPAENGTAVNSLFIGGWALSEVGNTTLKYQIDGKEEQEITHRVERSDVLKAFKNYGDEKTNPKPGFDGSVDISDLDYDTHTITVTLYDNSGRRLTQVTKHFIKRAPASTISFDYPAENGTAVNSLFIGGWALSEVGNTTLKYQIDQQAEQEVTHRVERSDVLKVFKGYGDITTNPTPGFDGVIDTSSLTYDTHTITVTLYDDSGKKLTQATKHFIKKAPESKISLDYPAENGTAVDSLFIGGWALSEVGNTTLKYRIDDDLTETVITHRVERNDVLKAIKGYGDITTNPTPGFDAAIDIKNLDYRVHTVTVVLYDSTGKVLTQAIKHFMKKAPSSTISLDYPVRNSTQRNNLFIGGWALSEVGNTTLKVKIDNQPTETVITNRSERPDVLKAIKGYGDITTNPKPGFDISLPIDSLSYGTHSVTVTLYEGDKALTSATNMFQITIPKVQLSIDTPKANSQVRKSVYIGGWVLSDEKDLEVHVLAADKDLGTLTRNIERDDANKAYPQYGGKTANPTPGYGGTVDLEYLNDGNVTLTLDIRDKHGNSIKKQNATVKLVKYDTTINITKPTNNSSFKDIMNVVGNVVSNGPVKTIDIYLNDTLIKSTNNLDYSFDYDVTDTKNGTYKLKVEVKTDRETIATKTIDVVIKKEYLTSFAIDDLDWLGAAEMIPNDGSLHVGGWAITSDKKTSPTDEIKIYIDGVLKAQGADITRAYRGDLKNNIPNYDSYGGDEANPTQSINAQIQGLPNGKHTITIKAFNHLGEEIGSYSKPFRLYSGYSLGIDVSNSNGKIDWNQVKASGVKFAIVRVGYRGFLYGNNVPDKRYVENIKGAHDAGLKVGIYFFSQATTATEGALEARDAMNYLTLNQLTNYIDPSIPIAIDVEDSTCASDGKCPGKADNLTTAQRTSAVAGFVNEIKNNYKRKAMIYASTSWLNGSNQRSNKRSIDLNGINEDDIWLAHWTNNLDVRPSYTGNYGFWQFAVGGQKDKNGNILYPKTVSGIESATIDLDVMYN